MRGYRCVAAATCSLAVAVASSTHTHATSSTGPPATCALYFDFHDTTLSHCFFGKASGTSLTRTANLGLRDDPQGQLTVSADGARFAFTTNDNSTRGEHFGCCDRESLLTVDIQTSKWSVASLHKKAEIDGTKVYEFQIQLIVCTSILFSCDLAAIVIVVTN
jgi:hypothetical protein